jgi:hypothetical protein
VRLPFLQNAVSYFEPASFVWAETTQVKSTRNNMQSYHSHLHCASEKNAGSKPAIFDRAGVSSIAKGYKAWKTIGFDQSLSEITSIPALANLTNDRI